MSFVLGNAKGSPILPWLLSLVQQGDFLSRGWGQHSHGVVSSAEVAPGRGAVLRKANLPICPHPCAALLLVQPAEAGREGLDQRRGRLAFPRGGEGEYIGTDVESRPLRRAGRSSTGSYKARCSEVLHCAESRHAGGSAYGKVQSTCESQRRSSTLLPGDNELFCSRREEASDPVKKSTAALTPPAKPLTLLPEPSGSRAAAGLDKTRICHAIPIQILVVFWFGHWLPVPGAKRTQFLYAMPPGSIWPYSG